MKKERHAVSEEAILEVGGIQVGGTLSVNYEDGPPEFGICQWLKCNEQATKETLIGVQLCAHHLSDFYSDKPAAFK